MTREPSPAASSGANGGVSDRLDSWKDVAAYLKRDVTTVQRWERREGMPIHRHVHDKQGSVYAFRSELDSWQRTRTRQVETEETQPSSASVAEPPRPDSEEAGVSSLPSVQQPAARPRRHQLGRFSAFAGLIGLVVAAIAFGVARGRVTPSAPPEITSLVVLPLENLSGDPARAYLAAGLTEELTASLAQLRALRVVSRTSAMAFEGRRVSLPAIGRELHVDAALEGSVRQQDGRVKVSIQLIHAPTDTHLWARDFERDVADLLQLQSDIARAVADEVRVQIRPDERARLASVPTDNPRAHEEYLLGRYLLWKFIEDDQLRAIEHFQRAISIAPDYAAPYAGLAHAWWMRGVLGPLSLKDVASPARDAAREALARDDRLAEAYAAQAYVQGVFDWDWAGAEATIQRAVQLEPNSMHAHYVYAVLLMAMGRLSEALGQIEHAAQVDPLSAPVHSMFGRILYRARRFDEAVDHLNRAIELEPRDSRSYGRLADVYALMGRYDEALGLYEEARVLAVDAKTAYRARVARTYARMGRAGDARRLLPSLQGLGGGAAAMHAALGEHDMAFTLLFRAVDGREDWFPFIKEDPDFDALHADHRWNELLQRMRLGNN
jgi:TolB-like protein/Tfp pilus assembly protein PilF